MRVVALAGGTGSAKLLRGLQKLPVDLAVVANVGDNAWIHGVFVCPDIDIATYALAGLADARGWGIKGDTFAALRGLSKLGADAWFRLGDRDLSTSLYRTEMIRSGATLTQATDRIRKALGVATPVLPVTDSDVETWVLTPRGAMHLQEFWVRERGAPAVLGVSYRGVRRARVTPDVESAVSGADRIVLCPANPLTSLGPMLAVPGFARALSASRGRTVALSPMVGRAPFSGPAGKFLRAAGVTPDSAGVARRYASFLDWLMISEADAPMKGTIEALGVRCATGNTLMRTPEDAVRLAKELLEL